MGSRSGWRVAGTEVPFLNLDAIEWRKCSVPSPASSNAPESVSNGSGSRFASSCLVGNPPTFFVWRISEKQSNLLEIIKLSNDNSEASQIGLRILFPYTLYPFAFLCEDGKNHGSENHFMLYAFTLSGIAYLIRLRKNFDFGALSLIPNDEIIEYNTLCQPNNGAITAVAAAAGCLFVGRRDGSVGFFQLGAVDPSAPGFIHELRDEAGIGRLWGILSWGPSRAAVQDLVVSDIQLRKFLFVLHSDGSFLIWDLITRGKIFSHTMSVPTPTGALSRLWVGEGSIDTGIIPLAMLQRHDLDHSSDSILLYHIRYYYMGDKWQFSLEPSLKEISLGEGILIDVKLSSKNLWILKEDGLVMQNIFSADNSEGSKYYYALLEKFGADLLFQTPEHSSDDLLWLAYSAFSSSKDEIAPFVSSVFLRALLYPGIHCRPVLRQTLVDYNKHFSDSEFSSFTVDGLKSEITSVIVHKDGHDSPMSVLQRWKTFGTQFMNNWCKYNAACALLLDPVTGAIGLVRNNTISLCRGLEEVERFMYGSLEEESKLICSGLNLSGDDLNQQIVLELLQCIRNVSQQFGKASSTIFYECLLSAPQLSSDDVVLRFLEVLETGYITFTAAQISELGVDPALDKELSNHRNLRKFATDMFLSLHGLHCKAKTWGKVLDVLESYLKFLVPQKIIFTSDTEAIVPTNISAVVHSTCQLSKMLLESTLDFLMLLSYMTSISGQINMLHDDVSRVKLELLPMTQEIVAEWCIIHFFVTTPSESPAIDDFSNQLSSLQIGGMFDKKSRMMLEKCEFSLASILLFSEVGFSKAPGGLPCLSGLPNPITLTQLFREFTSWIIYGKSGEESSVFFSNSIDLATILLTNAQYKATEYLLTLVDRHSRMEKSFVSVRDLDDKLASHFHLLGCCLVAQTNGLHGATRDRKVGESILCFFRAASVVGSCTSLQSISSQVCFSSSPSEAASKLHYYQWVMQLFEQYNFSNAASQFALASLEQVDAALGSIRSSPGENIGESAADMKGRLWANVFKFSLDVNNYHDAYCAIISNPDVESKTTCLRRFIIVLFELGAAKILCNGQLPLIGLLEKVERELALKAERSYISSNLNPFKLLYSFEMHRHNWRKAASYMYLYSVRLKSETAVKDRKQRSITLQERLNGLSSAINGLQLVQPAYAWIEGPVEEVSVGKRDYPNKKARITPEEQSPQDDVLAQKLPSYIDAEKLENEFILTSAQYLLSLASTTWTFSGTDKPPSDLIDLLVESNYYDMAFTVILKFWKGSGLKRELERPFITMALKCCTSRLVPSRHGKDQKVHGLLLASSQDERLHNSLQASTAEQQFAGNSYWVTLELYLNKYIELHPRLPLVVAGTLLSADDQIELPLWLVRHFKGERKETSFGMRGSESSPASLFCLYVDYRRYADAVNLLIDYMGSLSSARPADIIRRKRVFAVWFPYTTIERLWCLLDESIRLGHMTEHCKKLKILMHGVLNDHLKMIKVDSEDVKSSTR